MTRKNAAIKMIGWSDCQLQKWDIRCVLEHTGAGLTM